MKVTRPAGAAPSAAGDGWQFVVQRHRTSHLHSDLRLGADGVRVSWAIPKRPTPGPDVRRQAMRVEDHSLDSYDSGASSWPASTAAKHKAVRSASFVPPPHG